MIQRAKALFVAACFVAACLAATACTEGNSPAPLDAGPEGDAASAEPHVTCDQMDVLFVVDNSPSMSQEQQNLSDNFDGFMESLRKFQDGTVDIRIGVTTTAFPVSLVSDWVIVPPNGSGALIKTAGMTEPWLSADDPDLSAKFRALATVTTDASGSDEQPLKAMRAALVDRVADGQNAGFLRPNALLALVVLTDGDDLSNDDPNLLDASGLIPVGSFVEAFDQLKSKREYWSAAVFAGGTAPSCSSTFGSASFAARLESFVDQAGDNAVFSSICDGDLSVGFDAALATFSGACEFLLF